MKVYQVTMNAGGTVRLGADRYTEDGKLRFYQGNILRSEFPAEDVSAIREEQQEPPTPTLLTTDAVVFGGSRS